MFSKFQPIESMLWNLGVDHTIILHLPYTWVQPELHHSRNWGPFYEVVGPLLHPWTLHTRTCSYPYTLPALIYISKQLERLCYHQ